MWGFWMERRWLGKDCRMWTLVECQLKSADTHSGSAQSEQRLQSASPSIRVELAAALSRLECTASNKLQHTFTSWRLHSDMLPSVGHLCLTDSDFPTLKDSKVWRTARR